MHPYYEKDIAEGRINREEAIELLEFLFLKYKETGMITDKEVILFQQETMALYFR